MTEDLTSPDPLPPPPGWPPWLVALLRGLLEAVVLAVLGWAIVALGEVSAGELAPFAPIAVLFLRQVEGLADQRIDPTRQRSKLGGAPVARTVTAPIHVDTTALVDELAARIAPPGEERADRPLHAPRE